MSDNIANVTNLRAEFAEALAALEACATGPTADDTILAWDNGLTVVKLENTIAVRAANLATAFTAEKGDFAYPVVLNGHKETAKPRRRGDVCSEQAEAVRDSIRRCDDYLAKRAA